MVNDGTLSSATQTTTINITGGPATASLFSPSATPGTITENDPSAVDLGVKFQASTNGTIIGIRFYKGPQNTGTHIGDLWTSSGTLLASATFTNETASGWQQVNFSSPVSITAGTTYIASYEAHVGEYSADGNYFANALYQRTADRAIELIERRQRGLCLWQLEPLPEQHLQCQQLLGRRAFSARAQPRHRRCSAMWRRRLLIPKLRHRRRCRRARPSATPKARTSSRERCRSAALRLTGDTLAATTTGTSITASYNASSGVLSLTGSDTLAHYQQVLDSVSYSSSSQNPTNSGADPSRTVSWVVNDGTLSSATQTTTVNITAVDNAPALSNVAASASYAALEVPRRPCRRLQRSATSIIRTSLGDGIDHQWVLDGRYAGSDD